MKSLLNHLDKEIDMTTMEILMTCMGFLLCVAIFAVVSILMMLVIWWMFKTDKDINIDLDSSEWEEEQ